MKGQILALLIFAGLLHNLGSAVAQTKKAAPKSAAKKTPVKRVAAVRKKLPPPVDPTLGDNVDGEDLTIRRAAVAAIGTMNGSVVVVDPTNGRVLTMVNQKLALQSGFIPCSTIKLVTSLAALSEHVVDRFQFISTGRLTSYNLDTALARSNNQYFAVLGNRLGFDRVNHYAQMLGLGEKAGLDIPGEKPGTIPVEPPRGGGMGMMTAFGEGFSVTPLELAGMVSAIANGGTLYYLQYPRTTAEAEAFTPKIKRTLELAPNGIEDVKAGMRGAVDYGTARRAFYDPTEPILGKTGTCTDFRSANHMGWFGSFNETGHHRLVVVVMLAGNHAFSGPVAAGVAGSVYRKLSEERYFVADTNKTNLPEIISTSPIPTAH